MNRIAPLRAAALSLAVAIADGAGKSTVLALAARLLDPDAGRVKLDGRPLPEVTRRSLRRAISMVGPETPLLSGSLARNLRYRAPRASERQQEQVFELCGVNEISAELPEGFATRLQEGGANLSQGQRQRIALARALLGRPRVLLLDEVDANLDPAARAALHRVLGRFRGTVLMVTHDRRQARSADVVWHFSGGRLVEQGDPKELLAADGPTAMLFQRKLGLVS